MSCPVRQTRQPRIELFLESRSDETGEQPAAEIPRHVEPDPVVDLGTAVGGLDAAAEPIIDGMLMSAPEAIVASKRSILECTAGLIVDDALKIEIAELHYGKGLSLLDVSKKLGVSMERLLRAGDEMMEDIKRLLLVWQRLDRGRMICELHGVKPGDEIDLSVDDCAAQVAAHREGEVCGHAAVAELFEISDGVSFAEFAECECW